MTHASFFCWLFTSCALAQAPAGNLEGYATVHDGDTIRIGSQSIRLQGVDAEELTEPHGYEARDALQAIVGRALIRCVPEGKSYNRVVATCFRDDGLNINAEIIRQGLALDCARYSRGKYRSVEPVGARDALIQKSYCEVRR